MPYAYDEKQSRTEGKQFSFLDSELSSANDDFLNVFVKLCICQA